MSVQLKFGQAGLSDSLYAGSGAREDGLNTGALVTVTALSPGTTNRVWIVDAPLDDTTAISSLASTGLGDDSVWTFSPTAGVDGGYLVEVIADEGTANETRDRKLFGIPSPKGLVTPALNESGVPTASSINNGAAVQAATDRNTDGSVRGWQPWMHKVTRTLTHAAYAKKQTFDNGDLSSGVFTFVHNLGGTATCTVLDDSGAIVEPDDVTPSDTQVAVDLGSFAPISGTWTLIVHAGVEQ